MNLLTVTYEEDLERSLIQAESIQKFVTNPNNYYIFINEAHDVCERLRHHFKQFKCTILTRADLPDYNYPSHGWDSQQLIKLAMVDYFKEDYLILDSKLFFTKPTDTNMYKGLGGNSLVPINRDDIKKSVRIYSNILSKPEPTHYLSMWPFYIDVKVFDNIDINSLQFDLFGALTPFEYAYYTVLCGEEYINTNINPNANGCLRVTMQKQFDIIDTWPDYHCMFFKPDLLTKEQMEIACDYVNSLGIKVQLKQAVCREIETFILKPVDNI
jgi:hypothetical protein|tara:strand:- start:479 stop:1288 length:810 start_codon:yes stop_codon:yes gene_type:complete